LDTSSVPEQELVVGLILTALDVARQHSRTQGDAPVRLRSWRGSQAMGVGLAVLDEGEGQPVLLLHGFRTPRAFGATKFRRFSRQVCV
jgi:hypothetical protein